MHGAISTFIVLKISLLYSKISAQSLFFLKNESCINFQTVCSLTGQGKFRNFKEIDTKFSLNEQLP